MTVLSTPTSTPAPAGRPGRRALWVLGFVVILFAAGYGLAWNEAATLSARYLSEAEASYARGDYLDALTGYEETISDSGKRVERGGFAQVVAIWRDDHAWPRPAYLDQAKTRIREIVAERLTIEDGERFVQENAGLNNPYFADIYLRLGELYEEAGDRPTAIEIYRDVVDSFRDRADVVAQATAHLEALGVTP